MYPTKEFDNFTFSQLDEFANDWIFKTGEHERVFRNQADEMRLGFFGTHRNNEKCKRIHDRVNFLWHLEDMIQKHTSVIGLRQEMLLQLVLKLEKKTELLDLPNITKDVSRDKIYSNIFEINSTMADIKNKMQEINYNVITTDQNDLKDPAEYIARILMNHLCTLEQIESKIEEMTNTLQIIHNKYCLLLRKPPPVVYKLCL